MRHRVSNLNQYLQRINVWATINDLRVNFKKSKCLIVGIYLGGQKIDIVNSANNRFQL